jgi:hypothetical protein
MQTSGNTAFDSFMSPYPGGGKIAYESAWLCGSTVLHAILSHWDTAFEGNPIVDEQITSAQQRQMADNATRLKHLPFGSLQTTALHGIKQAVRNNITSWPGLFVLIGAAAIFKWLIFKRHANKNSRSTDKTGES